ncbi:ISPg3, transposase, interruption family protein [Bacteroides finegoldii DSM 17565]|nr:ISPg3, transposase, interruption family protein [Bacteroides finegoldii DSM 17565]
MQTKDILVRLYLRIFPLMVYSLSLKLKTMKNSLMSIVDKILLRKRALIETVNDELKNIAQIEHSRHRSFNNFIVNSLSAIAAYCFFEKKPAIDVNFINYGQLAIF